MNPGGLKVTVTGPTGDIGLATLRALEASPEVERVVGMARRPFDPSKHDLTKVSYSQGDVLDPKSVAAAVAGADVVIHLAFIVVGDPAEAERINLEGSRNVFEAAVAAGVKRLVYTSSVAAYGFHEDNPQPLTEDVPARGTESFYYSAHKAELEALLDEVVAGSGVDTYVFRPCIVAGPDATTLVETFVRMLPVYGQLPLLRRFVAEIPFLAPIVPDPGAQVQLVHCDDVASALVAAAEGRGEPGTYNLGADGILSLSELARGMGWWSVPVPHGLLGPVEDVLSRIPGAPVEAAWLIMISVPVVMDCSKARRDLGWEPAYDTAETWEAALAGAREHGVL